MITAFQATFDVLENLKPGSWIIDTGATTHMCTDQNQFINLSLMRNSVPIKLPDGSISHVTKIGDVNLTANLVLKNVLYTPNFKFNLMSVSKLSSSGKIKFTFYPAYCILQDLRTERVIAKGKTMGSLYVFDNSSTILNKDVTASDCIVSNCCKHVEIPSGDSECNKNTDHISNSSNCLKKRSDSHPDCNKTIDRINDSVNCLKMQSTSNSNSSLSIWQKRLAHTSYIALQHLNSLDVSLTIDKNKKTCLQACEICHKAKQTRLPFPTHTSNTSKTFQIVHIDI